MECWWKFNTATEFIFQAAGYQTAALAFGGSPDPGPTTSAYTEEYNGSTLDT
jgi:hypothetical protein